VPVQEAITDYLDSYRAPRVSELLLDLTLRLRQRGAKANLALEEEPKTADDRARVPEEHRHKRKFYRLTEAGEDLLDNLFPPARGERGDP
jgi:hypothetical protein